MACGIVRDEGDDARHGCGADISAVFYAKSCLRGIRSSQYIWSGGAFLDVALPRGCAGGAGVLLSALPHVPALMEA